MTFSDPICPTPTPNLQDLVAGEIGTPVEPAVAAIAARIAARHAGASAILFYGSCLRRSELAGQMLDFYLIVESYERAFGSPLLALANRLLPPNVFRFEHDGLQAKYAVLSGDDLHRLASAQTRSVSIWARFAQPSRIAWTAGPAATEATVAAIAGAAPALLLAARPMVPDRIDVFELWSRALALTYAAELRPERRRGIGLLAVADPERYRVMTIAALAAAGIEARMDGDDVVFDRAVAPRDRRAAERLWLLRRCEGKALNALRLLKAGFTFAGGIDYLAWKVSRHTGERLILKPWQRRWPLLGALSLLPGLIIRGSVR